MKMINCGGFEIDERHFDLHKDEATNKYELSLKDGAIQPTIPVITIDQSQTIEVEPLTVQLTDEQMDVLLSGISFVRLDLTAFNYGTSAFSVTQTSAKVLLERVITLYNFTDDEITDVRDVSIVIDRTSKIGTMLDKELTTPFVVGFTPDSEDLFEANWSCDKSYGEIMTALYEGKNVVATVLGSNGYTTLISYAFNIIYFYMFLDEHNSGTPLFFNLSVDFDNTVEISVNERLGAPYRVEFGYGVDEDGEITRQWIERGDFYTAIEVGQPIIGYFYGRPNEEDLYTSCVTHDNESLKFYFYETATKVHVITWYGDGDEDFNFETIDLAKATYNSDSERLAALEALGCTVDENGFVKWTAKD